MLLSDTRIARTGSQEGFSDVSVPQSTAQTGIIRVPLQRISSVRIITDSLLLVCVLAAIAAFSMAPSRSMDEDLWWHLRTGNWILQYYRIPAVDSFALYTTGKPWIAYSWLFEVLVAKLYSHCGLHGILALTESLMLASSAALIALLSRYVNLRRAMILACVATIAMLQLGSPRPWWFTILFSICELYCLLQARERGRSEWLYPIVPLFALWANIHIQFVYGLGVIALFGLEPLIARVVNCRDACARLRARWFWAVLFTSCGATLINPYGSRLYSVIFQYATEKAPLRLVNEMQPFGFRSITDWAALLLVCCAFFTQGHSSKRSILMLSLLTASCWFGFRSARDVWFVAIISALSIASGIRSADLNVVRASAWKEWSIALPLAAALAFASLLSPKVTEVHLRAAAAKRFPEDAAAYIEKHHLTGPLYNSYGWGGYLIWRLPRLPVSIDGRANLHGDQGLVRWAHSFDGKPDWATDPALRNANTILLERDSALASILRSNSGYRLLYEDNVASVFEPTSRN